MVAIAAIGLIAFIVHLTVRRNEKSTSDLREQQIVVGKSKWFEYLLAVVAVLGLIVAVIAGACGLVFFGLVNRERRKLLVVPYFLLAALNLLQFCYSLAEQQRINWIAICFVLACVVASVRQFRSSGSTQ